MGIMGIEPIYPKPRLSIAAKAHKKYPYLLRDLEINDSNHVIWDGVICDSLNTNRTGQLGLNNCKYFTFRNGAQYGSYVDYGASEFSMEACEYVMHYNSEIAYCGQYDVPGGNDWHGFRPQYNNRWLWLIDSHIHHMNGDSSQVGNSNNPNTAAQTSHYVWIGGGDAHNNQENAYDNKNGFHCVVSQCTVHDFDGAGAGGANATGIIIAQDSEGPHSAYHWAIGNTVYNCGTGIRNSENGATAGSKTFIIGNHVYDCADVGIIEAHSSPDVAGIESYIIGNTVRNITGNKCIDINMWQTVNPVDMYIRRNIVEGDITVSGAGGIDQYEVVDNLVTGSIAGSPTVDTGNILGQDPLFTNPVTNDITLQNSSPAKDATTEDAVYQLFADMYGMDIKRDLLDTARPINTWDIGATEQ